jgi:hypothetical protein
MACHIRKFTWMIQEGVGSQVPSILLQIIYSVHNFIRLTWCKLLRTDQKHSCHSVLDCCIQCCYQWTMSSEVFLKEDRMTGQKGKAIHHTSMRQTAWRHTVSYRIKESVLSLQIISTEMQSFRKVL